MEPDLCDLLSAWLGSEIEPARREALLERLRRDGGFRRAFVAEIWMHGMVKTVQSPEPRWLGLEDELGWSAAESSPGETLEDRIVGQLDDRPRTGLRRFRRWRWAAAAAAALLAAFLLSTRWTRGPRVGPVPAVQVYPRVDTLTGLAMIIKLDRVQWTPTGDPHPSEGDVVAAGHLRFQSGRIVLSMLTGVVLFVEGPADVELVSDDKVLCHQGKMRVRVPNGIENFVASGPGSAVIDLGTEFDMNVGPGGKAFTRVVKGRVEAAVTSADGIPQRTRLVRESEAFEIDPQAGQITASKGPVVYTTPSNLSTPPLVLDADYSAAILRSRPACYWRFESLSDGAIPNEVSGGPPLRVTGPIRLADASAGNRCAVFLSVEERQDLEMEGLWQPTWRPGFAVELWCVSESISHTTMASMSASHDSNNHLFLLELTSRNGLHKPASVRLLHRWPPGGAGGDNVYSRDPYLPYRWHHIVGQINGEKMELFVDGDPLPSLSIKPEHGDMPCRFLLGRLTTRPGSGISIDRPLVGRLDEVALYERPLTLEEIRTHHRQGTGQPRVLNRGTEPPLRTP
jgi:hypothetical protein